MWYDITADRCSHHDFDLDTRQLSIFGNDADRAQVQIILRPGADITVTTPRPETLRLVGSKTNRDNWLAVNAAQPTRCSQREGQ